MSCDERRNRDLNVGASTTDLDGWKLRIRSLILGTSSLSDEYFDRETVEDPLVSVDRSVRYLDRVDDEGARLDE